MQSMHHELVFMLGSPAISFENVLQSSTPHEPNILQSTRVA